MPKRMVLTVEYNTRVWRAVLLVVASTGCAELPLLICHKEGGPAWNDEGLADYLSSAKLAGGQVEIGAVPSRRRMNEEWPHVLPTPDRIVRVTSYEFHHQRWADLYYPAAWALVHWLAGSSPTRER